MTTDPKGPSGAPPSERRSPVDPAADASSASGAAGRPAWVPVAYPTLIGGAFFLFLFVASGASPFAAVRMIVVAIIACLLVTIACGLVLSDRDRGGLLALSVVLIVITGNELPKFLALSVGAAMLVVERLATRRRPSRIRWSLITRAANAIGAIVVLSVGIQAYQQGTISAVLDDLRAEGPAFLRPDGPAAVGPGVHPDIYVIMLDGYLRPDKQQTLLGHDDRGFVADLEARGFQIAGNSRSNYLLTAVSLSSFLNLRQLDDQQGLAALSVNDPRHVRGARRLINDNEVFRRLHALGYETAAIASGFEEVALRRADRFIDTGQLNEVELLPFRHTALGNLVALVDPDLYAQQQRDRINQEFAAAAEYARANHDRPRFLFVHIPSPHAPVVFDAAGGPVQSRNLPQFYEDSAFGRGITRAQYSAGYGGQVDYLNRRTTELVDAILEASAEPPIVIVMSDHGSGAGLNVTDFDHSDLDERSANLLATLTPGRHDVFGDDITLVNVFGRLFNAYFGTDYPTQPDTVYRWTGTSIFDLVPVTGLPTGSE